MREAIRNFIRKERNWNKIGIIAAVAVMISGMVVSGLLYGKTDPSREPKPTLTVATSVGINLLRYDSSSIDSVAIDDASDSATIMFSRPRVVSRESTKAVVFSYAESQTDAVMKLVTEGGYSYDVSPSSSSSSTSTSPHASSAIPSWASAMLWFTVFSAMMSGVLWLVRRARMRKGMGVPTMGSRASIPTAQFTGIKSDHKNKQYLGFSSVRGEDTAVSEISEVKDMLLKPDEYAASGAKAPRGVLLYGPPGTGKTLLARALAVETNSTFYSVSGSSFIEMYAGVGAQRVRTLFNTARENAPSIIFIDEIDAIGGSRSAGDMNSEREQTLNQMLVEMDGFEDHGRVLVVAATNRPDMLDKALLRPGRFDRQISVDIPDMAGREDIIRFHALGKRLSNDVSIHWVAQQTSGFSGAQLASALNEAAVMSVRNGEEEITVDDVSEGIDRVLAGPQKTARKDYRKTLRTTAIHEGGHAIVAMSLSDADPVTKITILPRGRALGYTMMSSDDDKTNYTRDQMLAQLAYAMGGRAAEEIIAGESSTGAASDFEKATQIARDMVTKFGYGGPTGYATWNTEGKELSESTKSMIDSIVIKMLDSAMATARRAITVNRNVLEELIDQLVEHETLNGSALQSIIDSVQKVPQEQ